eukprot:Platyproteum_vivax@DN2362_c0_g1_i1.p1
MKIDDIIESTKHWNYTSNYNFGTLKFKAAFSNFPRKPFTGVAIWNHDIKIPKAISTIWAEDDQNEQPMKGVSLLSPAATRVPSLSSTGSPIASAQASPSASLQVPPPSLYASEKSNNTYFTPATTPVFATPDSSRKPSPASCESRAVSCLSDPHRSDGLSLFHHFMFDEPIKPPTMPVEKSSSPSALHASLSTESKSEHVEKISRTAYFYGPGSSALHDPCLV